MENQFKKDLKFPILARRRLLTAEEEKRKYKSVYKELEGKNLLASRELTELFIETEEAEEAEELEELEK